MNLKFFYTLRTENLYVSCEIVWLKPYLHCKWKKLQIFETVWTLIQQPSHYDMDK